LGGGETKKTFEGAKGMNIGKGNEKGESKREEEYYETIKAKLGKLLKANLTNFHLEITANRRFSNKLKAEIPEEIKRLAKVVSSLLSGGYKRTTLAHFDPDKRDFIEWFERNPFSD